VWALAQSRQRGDLGKQGPAGRDLAHPVGKMTQFGYFLYGTLCGMGYLAVAVFLSVVLVFLFVTLVALAADGVQKVIAGHVRGTGSRSFVARATA
jgi:uncharacterized membrane protein